MAGLYDIDIWQTKAPPHYFLILFIKIVKYDSFLMFNNFQGFILWILIRIHFVCEI